MLETVADYTEGQLTGSLGQILVGSAEFKDRESGHQLQDEGQDNVIIVLLRRQDPSWKEEKSGSTSYVFIPQ